MGKIKDNIYNTLVRKNENVQYEYERYVMEHIVEHYEHRFTHWKILWKLNWHYRIKKETKPLLYTNNHQIQDRQEIIINTQDNNPEKVSQENQKPGLPYMFGSESSATKRTPMHIWVKGLFDYDVISFDIFDTLLLRKVNDPKDIFMILGDKHNIIDFYAIRIQAEADARTLHNAIYGNREITIFDIYELIEKRTGLDKNIGIEAEFELERKICFANPYMKNAYDILKSREKQIYIVSDMYWPKEYLIQLLHLNGYDRFQDLLVSCEYKGNKTNGILFQTLISKAGKRKKFIHVGDNYKADIEAAVNYGIDTRFYANVQSCGNQYRENGMSPLIRAAYRGIVNSHLHNGMEHYNEQFEYGFLYGGLFVLGYINWIHDCAQKKGIDKILFFARDGYIYKKIYDKLFDDIPSEYVFWSRVASLKYACDFNRNDFLVRMIDHKFGQDLTIESMLHIIGLKKMIPLLAKYKLSPTEIIHPGNKQYLMEFFVENWEYMLELQETGQKHAEKYYRNILANSRNVAFVDVGWRGDNQLVLKQLIQKKWKINCDIYSFMAATITAERNASFIMDEQLCCYIFSSSYNRMLYDSFKKNISINTALFEMFSQAPHPSFNGFGPNGEYEFGYAEIENYKIYEDILLGIELFCDDYISCFGEYKFMMNISGYDAYIPFRGLIRNYHSAKNGVGKVRFQQGVGIDYAKQNTKTLLELMSEKNI